MPCTTDDTHKSKINTRRTMRKQDITRKGGNIYRQNKSFLLPSLNTRTYTHPVPASLAHLPSDQINITLCITKCPFPASFPTHKSLSPTQSVVPSGSLYKLFLCVTFYKHLDPCLSRPYSLSTVPSVFLPFNLNPIFLSVVVLFKYITLHSNSVFLN